MTLRGDFAHICDALAAACAQVYGDRLVSVAIFGSVARGAMRPDSDIDVLLVVENLPDGRLPRMAEFSAVEERLKPVLAEARGRGVHSDVIPIIRTPDEVRLGSPLYLDMTHSAKALIDRDGFMVDFLERLRRRLDRAGAHRVARAGGYYWDLPAEFDLAEPPR